MNHTIILTDEDLTVIDQALQEVKFRLAAPVVVKINKQLAAEQTAQRAAEKLDKPTVDTA